MGSAQCSKSACHAAEYVRCVYTGRETERRRDGETERRRDGDRETATATATATAAEAKQERQSAREWAREGREREGKRACRASWVTKRFAPSTIVRAEGVPSGRRKSRLRPHALDGGRKPTCRRLPPSGLLDGGCNPCCGRLQSASPACSVRGGRWGTRQLEPLIVDGRPPPVTKTSACTRLCIELRLAAPSACSAEWKAPCGPSWSARRSLSGRPATTWANGCHHRHQRPLPHAPGAIVPYTRGNNPMHQRPRLYVSEVVATCQRRAAGGARGGAATLLSVLTTLTMVTMLTTLAMLTMLATLG